LNRKGRKNNRLPSSKMGFRIIPALFIENQRIHY
jgi:hypothetical protein